MPLTDDLLPDAVLDAHWQSDTSDEDDPELAADDDSPADDSEETSDVDDDEEPEEENEDTEEEEAGEEEPEDEEEDEDEDAEEDTSDEEPDEEPTFFDRKEIQAIKDPEARKVAQRAYNSMHGAFTRATQAVRAKERVADQAIRKLNDFSSMLKDEEGAVDFLLDMALQRPEWMEKAYERFAELNEDEAEKKVYLREKDVERREKELEEKKTASAEDRRAERAREITSAYERLGQKAGLEDDDYELVEELLTAKIRENGLAEKRFDVTEEEIQAVVQRAAKMLRRTAERTEKKVKRKVRTEAHERVKRAAKGQRTPQPPRSTGSPGPRRKDAPKPRRGEDSLDALIDTRLGLR